MTVLLLGATGNVGPHVARALVRRGAQVRALVRDKAKAAALLPDEVDLVAGDLDDQVDVRAALDGATAMFLLTPHGPDMATLQITLARLAAQAGVRLVKLSGTSSAIRPDGPDAGRQHWQVEQELAGLDVGHVVLRPNAFMQTLIAAMAASVRASGAITNPLGDAGLSLIDCADIGEVAAAVLLESTSDGKTLVLTGPAAPTYPDIAATIAKCLGSPVGVVDVTPQQAGDAVLARGGTAWEARHLSEMLTLFRGHESEYVTDDVAGVTGRAPRSVDDFIHDHRADFLPD